MLLTVAHISLYQIRRIHTAIWLHVCNPFTIYNIQYSQKDVNKYHSPSPYAFIFLGGINIVLRTKLVIVQNVSLFKDFITRIKRKRFCYRQFGRLIITKKAQFPWRMVFQTNEVVNLHGGSNYFCYYVEQETSTKLIA